MRWWPLSNPGTDRERRFAFLLPPILWAVLAALGPLPALNRLDLGNEVMPIIALAGMVGGSFGLLQVDWRAPDGFDGWGRVAALWLGFVLLIPGTAMWGSRLDPHPTGFVVLTTAWVIFSALPFGRWESLNTFQCLGFSLRFFGAWLVVLVAAGPLPSDHAGWILAVAFVLSPAYARRLRQRLPVRATFWQSDWSTPYCAARRRRFFAILVPLLALGCYDLVSTFGGKAPPHFGGLLQAMGVPLFPWIGVVGLFVVQILPPYLLVLWMRGGLTPKAFLEVDGLVEHVLLAYVMTTGFVWIVWAVMHQLSEWFFHPWTDDYPATALFVVIVLTVACGLFWYRCLLGMEVMAKRGGRHDG